MAIRIDLLPKYVAMRRWFKRILAICLMLVSAFAAALFVFYYSEQLRLQTLKTNLANIKIFADKADAAQTAADTSTTQAQPLQSNVNFFVDAGRTGPERAALLDLIRRYVYSGAVVGTLDISDGKTAKFSAMVRSPDDYARFLLNLRSGTVPTGILFADLPTAAGIPGYPNTSVSTATPGQPGAPAPTPTPTPVAVPGQPQTGQTAVDNTRYFVFPNNITASANLREQILVPLAPGETAAATPPGAPGAAPPTAPAPNPTPPPAT